MNTLVLDHLHLVRAVARQVCSRYDVARWPAAPVDRDDYLAAGAEALVRAARTWRPDRGSPFVPYAWAAIGWAMRAEQSRMRWRRQADRRPDRTPTWWRYGWPSSRRSPHLQAVVRLCWIEDWSRRRQGVGSGSPSRQWRCVRGPLVGAG